MFTPLPIARVGDPWLCAPGEQTLSGAIGAARRRASKAFAQLFELQRTPLRLELRRTFETEQQFQLEQYFAARFGIALDPRYVRGGRGFIDERA